MLLMNVFILVFILSSSFFTSIFIYLCLFRLFSANFSLLSSELSWFFCTISILSFGLSVILEREYLIFSDAILNRGVILELFLLTFKHLLYKYVFRMSLVELFLMATSPLASKGSLFIGNNSLKPS